VHAALLHVRPALERLPGQHFRRPGLLELHAVAGIPARLRMQGEDGLRQVAVARVRAVTPAGVVDTNTSPAPEYGPAYSRDQ
jgi:hypothetical protein